MYGRNLRRLSLARGTVGAASLGNDEGHDHNR
jgi:hypothetical protein